MRSKQLNKVNYMLLQVNFLISIYDVNFKNQTRNSEGFQEVRIITYLFIYISICQEIRSSSSPHLQGPK